MTEIKPGRQFAKRALMWGAAIAILAWLFHRIPPGETARALTMIQPLPFAAALVAFSIFTLALDSITHWWVFNRFNPPIRLKDVILARGESYLLLSLGFIYGQGGMAFAVAKRTGKPVKEIAGSLLFLMFNNLIPMMLFPTLSLLIFARETLSPEFLHSPEGRTVITWLAVCWPICIGLIVFFARDWDNPIRRRFKDGIHQGFDQARPIDYAKAMALRATQVVNWCFFSWLAVRTFSIDIPFHDFFILGPIVGLVSVIPTPGRLGTTQGAWVFLFKNLADPAALFAFSLMWTICVNLLRWLIGALFLALSPKTPPLQED